MKRIIKDPYVRLWNRLADGGERCSGGFDPKNDPDDRKTMLLVILAAIAFIVMFVVFSGCTRKVYVPVDRTRTVTETLVDTVVEIRLERMADTVTVEAYGRDTSSYLSDGLYYSHASWQGGMLGHSLGTLPGAKVSDTLQIRYIHTTDSIPYPVEVEKALTLWEKAKMEYGGFSIGVSAALLGVIFIMLKSGVKKN